MNSVPWIGKIVGCFIIEPLINRVGYRPSIIIAAFIQILALIIEMTAKGWQQYTVGRNFAYLSVGLVRRPTPWTSSPVAVFLFVGPRCNPIF